VAGQVTLGTAYRFLESMFGQVPLLQVHFYSPIPNARTQNALAELFGAPVFGGIGADALVFPGAFAQQSIPAMPEAKAAAAAIEKEIHAHHGGKNLESEVLRHIRQIFPNPPRIQSVAQRMGLGARTLQRRLSARGIRFSRLVDEARSTTAHHFLRRGFSVTDVAFLVGYDDSTAFSRAYRRATGRAPREDTRLAKG
jgi:AraC-like DNA-binding protein